MDSLRGQQWFRDDLHVLDLGCGNGRHALALAPYVKRMTGLDLSDAQLKMAEESRRDERCVFVKGDMRDFQLGEKFDLILNLFTSFGYFDRADDNMRVLRCVRDHLRSTGVFVLDYLNAAWVRAHLIPKEKIILDGIQFDITRTIEHSRIHKIIQVAGGENEEVVTLFSDAELQEMLTSAGLQPSEVYGSYHLDAFDAQTSQRCIIFARPI